MNEKWKLFPEQEKWQADLQELLDKSPNLTAATRAELVRWGDGAGVRIIGPFPDLRTAWTAACSEKSLTAHLKSWKPDWGYLLVVLMTHRGGPEFHGTKVENHKFAARPFMIRKVPGYPGVVSLEEDQ